MTAISTRYYTFLVAVSAVLMASFALAAAPTSKVSAPSPAVIHVRQAAMIPQGTMMIHQVKISGIDDKTRDTLVEAMTKEIDADRAIVAEAQAHPDQEQELIARVKSEKQKMQEVAKGSGLSIEKYGPQMDRASKIATYEATVFTTEPTDYARLKIQDPLPKLLAKLALRPDQRTALTRIQTEARARKRAIHQEMNAVIEQGGDFESLLWTLETQAAGVEAAQKFRDLLDKDQVTKWEEGILANRAKGVQSGH